MWSLDNSKMVKPTNVGFFHKIDSFRILTMVTSSFRILNDSKFDWAMYRSAWIWFVTRRTSIRFLRSSHILPNTALLHSLYKFRSNSEVALARIWVLKSIYGFSQGACLYWTAR